MMQLQTEGLADLIVAHLRLLDQATRIAEEASRGAAPETVDVGQRLMAAVGDAKGAAAPKGEKVQPIDASEWGKGVTRK